MSVLILVSVALGTQDRWSIFRSYTICRTAAECAIALVGYLHTVEPPADQHDAYQRLVVAEIPIMLRVALSLTPQPADAHDLVQDTLLRAWRSFDTFDGKHPRAWLLTILRNAHRNSVRTRRPDPVDPAALPAGPATPSAEETAQLGEWDQAVAAGLSALKPDVRRLVLLVDVDGLSYAEAAAVLGIPEGTVMSRLHRARKKIKARVEAQRASLPGGAS